MADPNQPVSVPSNQPSQPIPVWQGNTAQARTVHARIPEEDSGYVRPNDPAFRDIPQAERSQVPPPPQSRQEQQTQPPIQPEQQNYETQDGQFQDQPADNQQYQQQPQYLYPDQPQPEYLLLEWVADSRVSRRHTKEYYSSLAVIVFLVALILFFAGQVLLIFVTLAFLFIAYVLSTVRAESVAHQVTTYGLRYRADKLVYWSELGRFWVRNNHGIAEIHIEAPTQFMNEIILLPANSRSPSPVQAEDIIDLLSRYLVFQEPLPSQIDRWVTWIQEKFPLE